MPNRQILPLNQPVAQLKLNAKHLLAHPANLFALGFGLGLARWGPGTVGTLLGIPLFLILQPFGLVVNVIAVALLFVFGVWCCDACSRNLQVHDHPGIVWDEVVGLLVTLLLAPMTVTAIVLGFAYFRLFDIVKPWPIGWVDRRVSGGLGIMLDDVFAGVFAWGALQITLRWLVPLAQ